MSGMAVPVEPEAGQSRGSNGLQKHVRQAIGLYAFTNRCCAYQGSGLARMPSRNSACACWTFDARNYTTTVGDQFTVRARPLFGSL